MNEPLKENKHLINSIDNVESKNCIEDILEITEDNILIKLKKHAAFRTDYEIVSNSIQEPYVVIPNYFFKINKTNPELKSILDDLKKLPETYVLKKLPKNFEKMESFYMTQEEYDKSKSEFNFFDLTYENFCSGKLSIYVYETKKIEQLALDKKELVFKKIFKLLHNPNLNNKDKVNLIAVLDDLDDKIISLINNFNYTSNVPKIIDITNESNNKKNMLLLLLNELGFDIIVFSPNSKPSVETKIKIPIISLETNKNINLKYINLYNFFYLEQTMFLIGYFICFLIFILNYEKIAYSSLNSIRFIFFTSLIMGIFIGYEDIINGLIFGNKKIISYGKALKHIFINVSLVAIYILVITNLLPMVNTFKGNLSIPAEYITEYDLYTKDYTSFEADKVSFATKDVKIVLSNNFVLYKNKLYGYIYSKNGHLRLNFMYKEKNLLDFILSDDKYLKTIPVKNIDFADSSEIPLILSVSDKYKQDPVENISINVTIVRTKSELNQYLKKYNLE